MSNIINILQLLQLQLAIEIPVDDLIEPKSRPHTIFIFCHYILWHICCNIFA